MRSGEDFLLRSFLVSTSALVAIAMAAPAYAQDASETEDNGSEIIVTARKSLSYRFDLGHRSITYTGDTGPSDAVTRLAQGSDMLVSEVIALEPIVPRSARAGLT